MEEWKWEDREESGQGEDERAIIQLETLDSLLWCNGGILIRQYKG